VRNRGKRGDNDKRTTDTEGVVNIIEENEGLQSFPKAHLVGQDRVLTVEPGIDQKVQASQLVGTDREPALGLLVGGDCAEVGRIRVFRRDALLKRGKAIQLTELLDELGAVNGSGSFPRALIIVENGPLHEIFAVSFGDYFLRNVESRIIIGLGRRTVPVALLIKV
jgi:hypothetical protein